MHSIWSTHLQVRTTIALLMVTVAIAAVFFALVYPIETGRTKEQIDRVGVLLETIYKQKHNDFANALFNGQHIAILENLSEIEDIVEEITNVCFFDRNKTINYCSSGAQYIPDEQLPSAARAVSPFVAFRDDGRTYAGYVNVVEIIGEPVGYVGIYYDISMILKSKTRLVGMITLLFGMGVLAIILLLNVFFHRSIIAPLKLLREGMKKVADGNLGEIVALARRDEIGDIGATFNEMSRKLLQNRSELRKHQIHLEELVRARTAELTIAKNLAEEASEKQREQWKLLKTVMETIPSPMFYKDLQGRYVGCNPAFEEFVGEPKNEILGRTIFEFTSRHLAERFAEKDAELINNPGKQSYTWQVTRPDGKQREIVFNKATITDDDGSVIGIVCIMSDITELMEARRQAEQANVAKGQFLANMSHEIRTPMNGVIGMTTLLLDTDLDETQRDYVETIRTSGDSLLCVINDILDYSKIEAGKLVLQHEPFNLQEMLDDCLDILAPRAAEKGLALLCDVAHDVPVNVVSDSGRIRQVLLNLAGNAVKFTESGEVRINVAREWETGDRIALRFSVVDTGIGIAAKDQVSLFDSFFQVDGSYTRRFGGTGLGLTISKQLVGLLGGTIEVRSEAGKGAAFTFTVVLRPGDMVMRTHEEVIPEVAGQNYARPILVVEDNRINLQVALGVLGKLGYSSVDTADNGSRALELLAEKPYDLVLMDLSMPGKDGFETTRLLRSSSETAPNRQVPVIALTAHAMRGDRERCLAAGMNGYLSKPLNPAEMEKMLAELWQIHPGGRRDSLLLGNGTEDERPNFDFDGLVDRLLGDRPMAAMIIRELAKELPRELDGLSELIRGEDSGKAGRQAHRMKGMVGNVGAASLQLLFAEMEAAGKGGQLERLKELMPLAETAARDLLEEINGFILLEE